METQKIGSFENATSTATFGDTENNTIMEISNAVMSMFQLVIATNTLQSIFRIVLAKSRTAGPTLKTLEE